jgi:hypothetical protein
MKVATAEPPWETVPHGEQAGFKLVEQPGGRASLQGAPMHSFQA